MLQLACNPKLGYFEPSHRYYMRYSSGSWNVHQRSRGSENPLSCIPTCQMEGASLVTVVAVETLSMTSVLDNSNKLERTESRPLIPGAKCLIIAHNDYGAVHL